jgi:predicted XRE-type DNA-binding protein
MTEKFIPKRKKEFIEFHKNSTETDLLKDILYNIEQNSLSQKKIESDIIQIQKNTFNVFVVLLIPIILSALIYTFLFLIA